MAISLGTAILELGANVARLQGDLGKAVKEIEGFKNRVERTFKQVAAALGTFEVASRALGAFKAQVDFGDELNDLATRSGLTAEQLLVLKGAADRGGGSLESLDAIIGKLPKRLQEAAQGSGDAAEAFQKLGIDVTNGGKGFTGIFDALDAIGAKFNEFADGPEKAALAIATLGKGGDKLIPALQAIRDFEERAKRLGLFISGDFLRQADAFNDKMQDVRDIISSNARVVIAQFLPALNVLVDKLIELGRVASSGSIGTVIAASIKAIGTAAIYAAGWLSEQNRQLSVMLEVGGMLKEGRIGDAWRRSLFNVEETKAARERVTQEIAKFREDIENAGKATPDGGRPNRPAAPTLQGDDARKAALAELKARAELTEKLVGEAAKEASERKAILDRFVAEGLVTEENYAAARRTINDEQREATLRAVAEEIALRQRAVGLTKPGSTERVAAEKELRDALEKRNDLERQFAVQSANTYLDAIRGANDYENTLANLDAQILEIRGNVEAVARIRFGLQNEKLINLGEQDPQIKRRVDELRQLTVAQAQLNQSREDASVIEQNLATFESRTQNSLKTSQITELEAMVRTGRARQDAVKQLEEVYKRQKAVAEAVGDKKMLADVDAFRAKIDELAASADIVGDKIKSTGEDALASFFEEFQKSGDAIAAFKRFTDTILAELSRLAARAVAQDIYSKVLGGGSGTGAAATSVFAQLLGGTGAGSGAYFNSTLGTGAAQQNATLSALAAAGYADGGRPRTGEWVMVGERGPELVRFDSPGTVISNHEVARQIGQRADTAAVRDFIEAAANDPDVAGKLKRAGRARMLGGNVIAGQDYLVGERRPEIVRPVQSGRVLSSAGGAGAAAMPKIDVTIMAQDMQSFRNSEAQITAGLRRAVSRASRHT